jgi:hypothetical protein
MRKIESFEQLREVIEALGDNLKRPIKLLVLISMITMIQLRKVYDHEAEARYAADMVAGESLPAIKGNFDLSVPALYCYDGEHRLNAARENGETYVLMELTPGTKRDATLNAAGVNARHGVERKEEDEVNAVMTLLNDKEWRTWSSTRIAKLTRTNVPFVEKLRQEKESRCAESSADSATPTKRKVLRNGTEYEMTIPAKPKKDPVEVALSKIVKLIESVDSEDRQRLVGAVVDKLKGNDATANTKSRSIFGISI